MGRDRLVTLNAETVDKLLAALHSRAPVAGLTHTHYKYPARFSPAFVREVIEALTDPGDLVLDPFMGGGTTLVEALAARRLTIGCDINPLAGFVTAVKTSPLSVQEASQIRNWQRNFASTLNLRRQLSMLNEWRGYDRHVPWWLRKTIQFGLESAISLPANRQRMFARCTLARTAQWALDCRTHVPGAREFIAKHEEHVFEMLVGDCALRERLQAHLGRTWRSKARAGTKIFVRSVAGIEADRRLPRSWAAPRLVLTSPPYAGVHILYHRWQVRGRRETSAPYWIIGEKNGMGASHFTFADRRNKSIEPYLSHMRHCFRSVHALMDEKSLLVQLVAFSDPEQQLPAYRETMLGLGFAQVEQLGCNLQVGPRERKVPNRKWYADAKGHIGASREFLLVHYKKQGALRPSNQGCVTWRAKKYSLPRY